MKVIVGAALAVLALSVLAYLLIGSGESANNAVSCAAQGGTCTEEQCGQPIETSEQGAEELCQGQGTCCQPLTIESDQ